MSDSLSEAEWRFEMECLTKVDECVVCYLNADHEIAGLGDQATLTGMRTNND